MTAIAAPLPAALRLPGGLVPALAALTAAWALWILPAALAAEARLALIVTALAVIGWAGTRLPEALVALAAAAALVLAGVVPEARLYAMLGSELVWLLLAAFLIAAVLKDSGLVLRLMAPLLRGRPRVVALIGALTAGIALTALVLPSTSGRAALLLPLCVALIAVLPDARLARAVAILFPTVILLSAGGSLVGAGAHLVAVEAIAVASGPRLDYLGWLMLGAPLALLASALGAALVLVLFVPRALWSARIAPLPEPGPMSREQKRIAGVLVALVGLWVTEPLHGIGMAMVAILGALALLSPAFGRRRTKDVFRAVDVELILFMAAAALMAQALIDTGADRWLVGAALAAIPAPLAGHGAVIAVALSAIAVASHLVITSRSARAAVLIPAVALPAAGFGHDPALMVMVVVMGTGFCQTLMASAKPVAIFAAAEGGGFAQRDLFRLALPLGPLMAALVAAFAIWVWPAQLAALRGPAPEVLRPVAAVALAPVAGLRLAGREAVVWTASASPGERPKARPEARPEVQPESQPGAAAAPRRAEAPQPRAERKAKPLRGLAAALRRDLRQAGRDLGKLFR